MTEMERAWLRTVKQRYDRHVRAAWAMPSDAPRRHALLRAVARAYRAEWDLLQATTPAQLCAVPRARTSHR